MHLRQDLKAPVENEFGVRVGALDLAHQGSHAGNLLLLRLGRFGHQVKRIQRVKKKGAKAPLPQRLDDLFQVKRAPARCRLVHHDRAPGRVVAQLPLWAHAAEVSAGGMHLAHRNVGRHGGAGVQPVAPARRAHIARLHHGHVERAQRLPRDVCPIIEGK